MKLKSTLLLTCAGFAALAFSSCTAHVNTPRTGTATHTTTTVDPYAPAATTTTRRTTTTRY
jgi:hypothetical protein